METTRLYANERSKVGQRRRPSAPKFPSVRADYNVVRAYTYGLYGSERP